jgi:hypothetical protein
MDTPTLRLMIRKKLADGRLPANHDVERQVLGHEPSGPA